MLKCVCSPTFFSEVGVNRFPGGRGTGVTVTSGKGCRLLGFGRGSFVILIQGAKGSLYLNYCRSDQPIGLYDLSFYLDYIFGYSSIRY